MDRTDVDVVDTSDDEEREVVLSEDDGLRPVLTPIKAIRVSTLLQSTPTERGPQRRVSSHLMSRKRNEKLSDPDVGTLLPRKRTKVHHTGSPVPTEMCSTDSSGWIGETPQLSPIVFAQPESPDPLQFVSARRSQAHIPSQPDSPLDAHAAHPSFMEPDSQPCNRYSLRRREARQMNPYAYDKLLYKQQLKSHPDAIVKFRSPPHRSGSYEADQRGTEDLISPFDDPEEDGDYVDVEGKSGRRKGSKGIDRADETVIDEGWLPEALKELSSSDDDDIEIQRLAKRIRKEREKAEAIARAEARQLAKETPQAELENKKRRIKPFPIRESGKRTPTNHPRRDPSPERFSSPSLLPRANSEPATSRPASPEKLPRGPSDEKNKKRKKWKQNSGANQLIYSFHHDGTHLTSKNHEGKSSRRRTIVVIESNDDECRQALDPGWRAEVERWNELVSPALLPAATSTSAPTTPHPRLYRRASLPPQNQFPIHFYFPRKEEPFSALHHRIIVDMNIIPLPSGVKFGASSYVQRGFLYQLILVTSGNSEAGPPPYCNVRGFEISSSTSAADFTALLGPLCNLLANALHDFSVDDSDTIKEWDSLTRALCQLLSWLVIHAEDQEFVTLGVALREYLDGLALVLESLETTLFSLTAHWFVLEAFARFTIGVKYRRGLAENGPVFQSAKRLIQRLLGVDLQPAFVAFHEAEGNVDVTLLSHRVAELWACLVHLLGSFETSSETAPGHLLWRLLGDLYPESSPTGLEASEEMWYIIFSLCAISQFSVHGLATSVFRLPAAWELVTAALKKIVLTDNPERNHRLPQRALKKRDDYVSCVVSRCFLLWSQWGWRLDGGVPMFKSLQEIFRSRNFANLLGERTVSMGFLERGDLELLSKQDQHDSVFEVFLKMVVQAVYLLNANVELEPKQRSAHIKKLLQIAVPVSPVPFSRSAPPSAHSLSMLVNRFNAMAVAVHLDPTPSNVKFRIIQARRCVSFRNADDQSRVACVYGMMNFAMLARHHKVVGGLEEVLGWLAEMVDILMDEYKEGEGAVGKKATTTLIQLLIRSVRRVVETASLDKRQGRAEYPDPVLLDGPWVTRVFNPRTDLVTIQQTGVEIRMLVQTFLDARLKVLPATQPPPPPVVHCIESQESQDEYDRLFLDLNDEELLAALGEETGASNVADLKSKEDMLCKVLDKFISPAVYRLVCKHFCENESAKNDATSIRVADEWIDCWVGCANVLVQNNYKEWGLYMKLGQQSWEKIIDSSWRRRVGLRFNLMLLRLDPGAFNKMRDEFIAVLLVATLSCKTTIEHEFIGIVLSLDGLKHPLLRGAPFYPIPGTKKYEVGPSDYQVARERLIQTVFSNTARCLGARVDAESQAYAELVVMMLSTMRDIYESAEDKETYGVFCRRIHEALMGYGELASHPRMADELEWGKKLAT